MRIGISALTFNLKEALKICENNKEINHIEIGIDNINDCEEVKKYEKEIKKLNLTIGIHLPMELNSCENIEFIRNKWTQYIIALDEKLSFLQTSYYNMHLGYVMANRLTKNKLKYLDNTIKFFDKLYDEKKLPITIENTYTKGGDFFNMGTEVEDFIYIFKKHKNLNFCYDTGHDLICKSNYDLIKNKIKIVHLSDNNKREDEHLGILKGKLTTEDLKYILNINPDFLVLEMKFNDINESLQILKQNYLK